MAFTRLLTPYVLGYKNRLIGRGARASREWLVFLFLFLFSFAIYRGVMHLLGNAHLHPDWPPDLPLKIISVGLFGFTVLLFFSNLVSALGFFFFAKDLPLLLTAPLSRLDLFTSRLFVALGHSSWVFFVLWIPTMAAFQNVLNLPWYFAICAILLTIPLLVIPAALASGVVTLFVNIIPIDRVHELLIIVIVGMLFLATWFSHRLPPSGFQDRRMDEFVSVFNEVDEPKPAWFPSHRVGETLSELMSGSVISIQPILELLLWCASSFILSFSVFSLLYSRGWTRALRGRRSLRITPSPILERLINVLLPFNPQLRSLLLKEMRMLLRDTTQLVQLVLLLILTFVYLYNFKGLHAASSLGPEMYAWWQTILVLANVVLGGCVLAALSTRFVYPAISIEGQAYWIVRSAPMSVRQLLIHKFLIWILPITLIACTLFVAGALVIQVPPMAVSLCAFLAFALSVGIVGLAIGIGAIYATFDWETTAQLSANVGSLIFMLGSFALIAITVVPASLLVIFANIPTVGERLGPLDSSIATLSASFLVFFVNFAVARWALGAGTDALIRRER